MAANYFRVNCEKCLSSCTIEKHFAFVEKGAAQVIFPVFYFGKAFSTVDIRSVIIAVPSKPNTKTNFNQICQYKF